MLLFDRPSFRSGVMIVRVTVNDVQGSFALRPADKGTVVDFGSYSAAVLEKYPAFFSIPV